MTSLDTDVRIRRVLVVDDDEKLAAVFARRLERAGYTCSVAASGDQALWAMAADPPDVVVLDIMIPHPSGIEVCRHVRSRGYQGGVVVISARGSLDDRAAAGRAGADRFLAKPFPLADLVAAVGTM